MERQGRESGLYRLDSKQSSVVDKAREVAEKQIAVHARRVDEQGVFPAESMRSLAEAGFLGLTVSPELGGLGQDLRVMCAVLEEVARACASTAMVYKMHLAGLACYAASEGASDYLREAAAGRHLSTLAWSEFGSRSHFWAPVSKALAVNGSQISISAHKSFVTSAGHADGYVVSTLASNARDWRDSALYLVLKEDTGIRVAGSWEAMGMRGNASAPMKLDGVRVGPERALSADGRGLEVMLKTVLPLFQMGNAAISVGIAEAALQTTQAHLTRTRFEHLQNRLADLPNLRARLAEMRMETSRARAHLVSTVDAVEDNSESAQMLVLEVKASASEAAKRVTELALQACGGAAYGKGLGLERNFRDARASQVMAPTTDQAYDFIGRSLCGMELF